MVHSTLLSASLCFYPTKLPCTYQFLWNRYCCCLTVFLCWLSAPTLNLFIFPPSVAIMFLCNQTSSLVLIQFIACPLNWPIPVSSGPVIAWMLFVSCLLLFFLQQDSRCKIYNPNSWLALLCKLAHRIWIDFSLLDWVAWCWIFYTKNKIPDSSYWKKFRGFKTKDNHALIKRHWPRAGGFNFAGVIRNQFRS